MATILLTLFLGVLLSCDSVDRTEIMRVGSSDSVVEAVVVRTNAGATTDFGYEVFVVKAGNVPESSKELFKADQVEELDVFWQSSKLLIIRYREARIFHFSNFWQSKDVQNFQYTVKVQLVEKPSVKS